MRLPQPFLQDGYVLAARCTARHEGSHRYAPVPSYRGWWACLGCGTLCTATAMRAEQPTTRAEAVRREREVRP